MTVLKILRDNCLRGETYGIGRQLVFFHKVNGGEAGARDMFEKVIEELLRAENPGKEVHLVRASQGDGGIDIYVHQGNGIDVYQCKFFMGSMNPSRWAQVKNSFNRALEFLTVMKPGG